MKHVIVLILSLSLSSCSSGLKSEAESVNQKLVELTEVMKTVKTDDDWKTAKAQIVETLVTDFDRLSSQLEENMDSYEREERNEFDDWKRPVLKGLRDELVKVTNQITANSSFTMGYDIKNAFRKLGDSGYLSDVSPKVDVGDSADKTYR